MAEIVDASAFMSTRTRSTYPWDEYFDGRARKLIRGQDFTCTANGFRSAAHRQAQNRGLTCRTQILDENTVLFQVLR